MVILNSEKNVALAHPRMARDSKVIPREGSERRRKLNKWTAWTNKRIHRQLLFLPPSGLEPGTSGDSDFAMTTTPSAHGFWMQKPGVTISILLDRIYTVINYVYCIRQYYHILFMVKQGCESRPLPTSSGANFRLWLQNNNNNIVTCRLRGTTWLAGKKSLKWSVFHHFWWHYV